MNRQEVIKTFAILLVINFSFFWKVISAGLIPFPGDLLVAEYKPWQTFSFLGFNPGAIPHKAQYFDTIRQLYPWKTLAIGQFGQMAWPLWNPYNFSGAPLLANFQSAVFYPLGLIYLVLPQIQAWTILVMLQPLLASFFTYLYGRSLNLTKPAALLAAIAFGFSLFMTVFLEYNSLGQTIIWLPLLLLAVEQFIIKRTLLWQIVFVLALVSMLFAGHLQLFTSILGFLLVYLWWRERKSAQIASRMSLLILLALGIGAIQLLPTLELFSLSARTSQPYEFLVDKLLIQPDQLIKLLSPDFFGNPATRNYLLTDTYPGKALYVGLIPLIFVLFAIIHQFKESLIHFFSLAAGVLLLLLTRSPLTELIYRLNLPLISTSSPTNAIFLLSFSLSILSGFGFDYFLKLRNQLRNQTFCSCLAVFWLIFIIIWLLTFVLKTNFSQKNFFYSTSLLTIASLFVIATSYLTRFKKWFILTFLVITVLDLGYFFQKFNPFVRKELVFPRVSVISWLTKNAGINRFWGLGAATIEANFATQYQLFSADGYDPLYPKRYGEFISLSREGTFLKSFDNQSRSDAVIVNGDNPASFTNNRFRLKLLNLLGTKYVLDRSENGDSQKTFPSEIFNLVTEIDSWKIYENKQALPRFFLASHYLIFKNKAEFEQLFSDPNLNLGKTILLERVPKQSLDQWASTGKANLVSYQPQEVKIKTETEGEQLLFLSDTYFPGWQVKIDGLKSELLRADYVFRAVVVPKGQHLVTFYYQPRSFNLGVKITIISIILCTGLLWFKRKIRQSH